MMIYANFLHILVVEALLVSFTANPFLSYIVNYWSSRTFASHFVEAFIFLGRQPGTVETDCQTLYAFLEFLDSLWNTDADLLGA